MSIGKYETKQGTRYRVRITLPNGHRSDKRGFRTKRDAQQYLNEYRSQRTLGTFVPESAGRIRVAELAQLALDSDVHRAATTQATREVHARKWVVPHWGDWPVRNVTAVDVRDWIRMMREEGAKNDTISKAHQFLNSIMNLAVEMRCIGTNPMPRLQLKKEEQQRRHFLTSTQVRELIDAAPANSRALIAVLAYTGMRFGEAAALQRSSVDVSRGRIHVVRAASEPKGQLVYGPPKGGRSRTVPLPAIVGRMLEPMLDAGPEDGLVFTTPAGAPLRLSTWRPRVFYSALDAVNLRRRNDGIRPFPSITPHDLRHTAASLAIQSGANVKVVQRMLGHRSAAMTLDVYADLFDTDLDDVAARMGALMFGDR